jgi:hypothetical protein
MDENLKDKGSIIIIQATHKSSNEASHEDKGSIIIIEATHKRISRTHLMPGIFLSNSFQIY